LIDRSLVVSPATMHSSTSDIFVSLPPTLSSKLVQPVHHVITGRRGTGKSSHILAAVNQLKSRGVPAVWIDMQRFHKRSDMACIAEVLAEIVAGVPGAMANEQTEELNRGIFDQDSGKTYLRRAASRIAKTLRHSVSQTGLYVFLDDFHLVGTDLQPLLLDIVYSVCRDSRIWLNVACVRHLAVLYDPARQIGVSVGHDVQPIELDKNLVNPLDTRRHLTDILEAFLRHCGFMNLGSLALPQARDRLVWCSGGVPRDCLALFSKALRSARQHQRHKLGVQEVNLAAGESAEFKLQQLSFEAAESVDEVRSAINTIQTFCLARRQANAFLALIDPQHPANRVLNRLADLRFIHLLHPGITTDKAGVRYQAYLLDFSFYTGMRRRQGITEVKIEGEGPKRERLRRLPKLDLNELSREYQPAVA
jgi:hypothetical protein